jgi:hypothetical protein
LGEVRLDRDSVTVGDPIAVQMRFAAPSTYKAAKVSWGHGPDTLLSLDTLSIHISNDSNWLVTTKVALFVPGRWSGGPNDILLLGPHSDSLYVLFPPESVTVLSVLPAGTDSIPPKPYKALISPPSRIAWWMWVASALFVLGVAALVYHVRKPRPAQVRAPEVARSPWELALERLNQLEGQKYHLRGEPRPFAIALSEIVRAYLEGRYGVDALEQTTGEIAVAIRHHLLTDPQRDALLRLLRGCDLAKYANFHWPAPELAASLTAARRFVEETTPAVLSPEAVR